MKLKLLESPTVDARDGSVVVIFPSRPYWFSATESVAEVLSVLRAEVTEQSALELLSSFCGEDIADIEEEFHSITDLLWENGVLSRDGVVIDVANSTMTPTHQVSDVESVLVIATTKACNLTCPHCHANAKEAFRQELRTEQVFGIIDDLSRMPWEREISSVALTGGEIFLRPDVLELIRYVAAKGFRVLVNTNATLIGETAIRALSLIPKIKLSVSLDGPDAETHEFIRGPGTFGKAAATIKELTDAGVYVAANMFVHEGNLNRVGDTLQLACDLGMRAFNCLPLMRVGRANSARSKKVLGRVNETDLYRVLFQLVRHNPQYQQMMRRSTFANQVMGIAAGVKSHSCGVGTNRAVYVTSNGELYPCPDTALKPFLLGNLKNQSLRDIWEGSGVLQQLRQLNVDTMNPTCSACDVRYLCGGNCRGENYQVTKDLSGPHYNCAEIRRSIIEIMWMLTEEPELFHGEVERLYDKAC